MLNDTGIEFGDEKLFEVFPEALIILTPDYKIQSINKSARQLFGKTTEDVSGKKITGLIAPREKAQQFLKMASASRAFISNSFKIKDKNNDEFILMAECCSPGKSFAKSLLLRLKPDGAYGEKFNLLNKNIDELSEQIKIRQAIETELRVNEKKLNAIFSQSAVGIMQSDLEGNIVYANEKFCEIINRPLKSVKKLQVNDITHPEDKIKNSEMLNRVLLNEESVVFEKRYVRPNGKEVWVSNSVSLIKDIEGNPQNIVAIVQDITDTKKIQDDLKVNEYRLSAFINQAAVGIAHMDITGKFIFANERYCQIVGRDLSDILSLKMQDITHKEDLPKNLILFNNTVETGEDFIIEKRYLKPDGSVVWVNKSVSLIKDLQENPIYVVAVVQDVTDGKIAESALRQAHEKLEQRVQDRTAQLVRSNDALMDEITERKKAEELLKKVQQELIQSEKLAALGRISTNIAHEIRNPLANISASSQYLIKKFVADPKIISLLNIIINNTQRASDKIKDLLDFASPNDLVLEKGNVVKLVEDTLSLVSPRGIKDNVKFIFKKSSETFPEILFNLKKLQEVLINLFTNSLDAMPIGGKLTINLYENRAENKVIINVKDTGSGIAQENIDKVFEPFFTTKHTGIGLGLSLVHKIIELHNGKLNIESEIGKGTSITIILPSQS